MLLTFKDNNTTDSFWLCHLFYVLSMIIVSLYVYKSVFIYNYYMYRWHDYGYVSIFVIGCYLCNILLAECISLNIFIYVDVM